jgi:hypothetical protein
MYTDTNHSKKEKTMQNRTTAIILTVASVLLCGCPGLALCIGGILTIAGLMPYTTTVNGYTTTGVAPSWLGIVGLCLSVIFVVIPIVVGVLTLRKKKEVAAPADIIPPSEPLPPAS